ncbi:hypothetical protein RchiOBHm_Chr5g0011701 [Rosa chinensis]|uniref:Uncharacterized protein n=1 Tax=Rosa chinensis TaxID=74649 RepID=A0A2P6Q4X1_ROSCH|nr:hypothetical protein RchiOBHm_Chr5g0011701 [Rosa chinensis]
MGLMVLGLGVLPLVYYGLFFMLKFSVIIFRVKNTNSTQIMVDSEFLYPSFQNYHFGT